MAKKIAVVAANGRVGQLAVKEAADRGFDVTAIVRKENKTVAPHTIEKDALDLTAQDLARKGIYPPVSILPSLSRLMKDGTGKGFTRDDHPDLSNQLFASYSEVSSARSLATVIGEDELSTRDKLYLKFGDELERRFINQGMYEPRSLDETLDMGWRLLSILPREELSRVSDKVLDAHYVGSQGGEKQA